MTAPHKIARYGWRPDLPDFRDLPYHLQVAPIPPEVDFRNDRYLPPVYDQGELGSCTANAAAAMLEYLQAVRWWNMTAVTPSRLFIYYFERYLEGTVDYDSGAMVRDALKVLHTYGAPPETEWPYKISRYRTAPTVKVDADALAHKVTRYLRVSRPHVQSVLARKLPVIFGFTVYESFETNIGASGVMPYPHIGEQILGGHCVMAIGYKQINGELHYICRNSWGPDWGDAGHFYMPARVILNSRMSSDFWAAEVVS